MLGAVACFAGKKHIYIEYDGHKFEIGSYIEEKNYKKEKYMIIENIGQCQAEIDQFLKTEKNEKILIYIHCWLGNNKIYHRNTLKKLNSIEGVSKLVSIVWKSPSVGYKKAWKKSFEIGKKLAPLLAYLNNGESECYLLCHSMGNRVFEGAFEEIKEMHIHFKKILLMAPDLNSSVFNDGLLEIENICGETIVFINRKDKLLFLSRIIHNKRRLGNDRYQGSDLETPKIKVKYVTGKLKIYEDLSGHLYFKNRKILKGQIAPEISQN